jgi:hypothetical protein
MPASSDATGGSAMIGPSAASSGSLLQRWVSSASTRAERARSWTKGAAAMRAWRASLVSLVLRVAGAPTYGALRLGIIQDLGGLVSSRLALPQGEALHFPDYPVDNSRFMLTAVFPIHELTPALLATAAGAGAAVVSRSWL